MSDLLNKIWLKLYFLVRFLHVKKQAICSFPLFNEWCEQISQVAHQKWGNEWITCFFERIALSLIFLQKTSNSLRIPMSKFQPWLLLLLYSSYWILLTSEVDAVTNNWHLISHYTTNTTTTTTTILIILAAADKWGGCGI